MEENNCLNCGKALRISSRFCSSCGASIKDGISYNSINVEIKESLEVSQLWIEFGKLLKLYGSILGIILFYNFISKATQHPIKEIVFWLSMVSVTFYFGFPFRNLVWPLLKFNYSGLKIYLQIILVAIACYFILKLYFSLFSYLPSETTSYTKNILKFKWPLWTAYFSLAFLPSFIEETIFRGIIYSKLKEILSKKDALLIQAACFSVLHLLPTIFISHFIMGLFLGWVREKTNSLYLCIGFHMAWNAMIVYQELRLY